LNVVERRGRRGWGNDEEGGQEELLARFRKLVTSFRFMSFIDSANELNNLSDDGARKVKDANKLRVGRNEEKAETILKACNERD
jgi:hypothetical protein